MISNYKESFLSRIIYLARLMYFRCGYFIHKVCKVYDQRKEYFTKNYWQNRHKKPKNDIFPKEEVVSRKDDCFENEVSDLPCRNERLAVYTCIFGNYDMINEPICKDRYCDYFIITDQIVNENSIWIKLNPTLPKDFANWPNSIKNRYFKMHPEKLLQDYEYSLYVDGNIILLTDVYPMLELLGNKFIGIFKHPQFGCFYKCAEFLKEIQLVRPEESDEQVRQYSQEGFPHDYGYFECGFLLRRHNHPKCIQLMDTWWEQYLKFVKRDQQSIMYSLWKNGLTQDDVACLGSNIRRHPRFFFRDHKNKHLIV